MQYSNFVLLYITYITLLFSSFFNMTPFYQQNTLREFSPLQRSSLNTQAAEVTQQFTDIINAQTILIERLLKNQKYLVENMRKMSDPSPCRKQIQEDYICCQKRHTQEVEQFLSNSVWPKQSSKQPNKKVIIIQSVKNQLQQCSKTVILNEQDSEYSQFCESEYKSSYKSETKNVIKNFAKSIFTFIRKNRAYIRKVLQHTGQKQIQFLKVYVSLKGRIHTIEGLRKLWTEQGNVFHRTFRIISIQFLRKHSLHHIFNSRVQNYKVHIKYRKKMLEILEDPQHFVSIKFD